MIFHCYTFFQSKIINKLLNSNLTCGTSIWGRSENKYRVSGTLVMPAENIKISNAYKKSAVDKKNKRLFK